MGDESFKIYGTTSDGKMLISAEEVQAVISKELAIAGEEIEQLKKENQSFVDILREAQTILRNDPAITDVVWSKMRPNSTLYEVIEMAINPNYQKNGSYRENDRQNNNTQRIK